MAMLYLGLYHLPCSSQYAEYMAMHSTDACPARAYRREDSTCSVWAGRWPCRCGSGQRALRELWWQGSWCARRWHQLNYS